MNYPNLFQEGRLGTRTVKNRIVLSPAGDNMAAPDGSFTEQSIAYYTERAKGGVGIVMPGAVPVDYQYGRSHAAAHRIDQLKYIGGMLRLTRNVHQYGALVIPQLQHAGARTVSANIDGEIPRCVSDVDPETASIRKCRAAGPQKELTAEEIRALIPKYVTAAKNCQAAECDGVEIHMTHSFLLNEFLSPDTNHRTDEYGGSLENRMRLPLAIVRAVREACGRNFIIGARIPGAEYVKNGLTPEEIRLLAIELEKAGCDVIDISVGMTVDQTKIRETQGTPDGARLEKVPNVKDAISVPVMVAGTFRDPQFCDKAVAEEKVDYVLMARQLICDPHWANKAKAGKAGEIRPCLTCNVGCFDSVPAGYPVSCVLNPLTGHEYENAENQRAEVSKNVMVIGGGIAGMQAAITAVKRGHKVRLFEKADRLGGQMNLACLPPDKDVIGRAKQWFEEETKRTGVEITMNHEVAIEDVEKMNPDHIIFAGGALPWAPDFPGKERAVWSWDVLEGKTKLPQGASAAVIGGGLVGCETAQKLMAENDNKMTVIEMMGTVAGGLEEANKEKLLKELNRGNTAFYTDTKVLSISETDVVCERNGREIKIPADEVVLAVGQRPAGGAFVKELEENGYDVMVIGDASKPANFAAATRTGYMAAARL